MEDRQYCMKVGCRKEGDLSIVEMNIGGAKIECKKGEETKKLELKGLKTDSGYEFKEGYVYCPEDVDRFCIS